MSLTVNPDAPPLPSPGTSGKLFVVGTPIGNLEDITLRALRVLKEVDLIACEDTRHTSKLLCHYDIHTPMLSYHEHNEMTRAPELVIQMEEGSQIALVSDAGMPVISDPGYRLVHLAIRHEIPVIPVPGASAIVAALAAAGLPVDKFRFLGFLPSRKNARRRSLKELENANKALVFYEAPHRLVEMLEDVHEFLGNRPIVVAREVTKVHEEFLRGPVATVLQSLRGQTVKGEITVLVGPGEESERKAEAPASIHREMELAMQDEGLDERQALKAVARRRGISKSDAYREWQHEKGFSRNPTS